MFCSYNFLAGNIANFKRTVLLKTKKTTYSTSREVTVFIIFHIPLKRKKVLKNR